MYDKMRSYNCNVTTYPNLLSFWVESTANAIGASIQCDSVLICENVTRVIVPDEIDQPFSYPFVKYTITVSTVKSLSFRAERSVHTEEPKTRLISHSEE